MTVTILALLGASALWGMRAGWRHRAERTGAVVPSLPAVPADDDPALGRALTAPIEATYVSSTVAGDWLERVVAHDLGVRSGAVVQVFTGGVRVRRHGAADLWVPAGALLAAGTAPGMAGKYVGGDGLVVLTWQPPSSGATADAPSDATADRAPAARLDTGLRPRRAEDRAALLRAARDLAAAATTTIPTEETA
ncbi:hypothetical protein [uncultured Cellulomonas sp.]|uniref:PH-like domain-containing protein n=1 Tax=uncultured Cellulomonas sp. TaxID=189682 RepID=UPI002612DC4A|nr:hypothetical protein [uncultured Cellulomonas sp.]